MFAIVVVVVTGAMVEVFGVAVAGDVKDRIRVSSFIIGGRERCVVVVVVVVVVLVGVVVVVAVVEVLVLQ